ncbi:acetylajmaline esterase [Sarracenia purpurea var. burkii]
MAANQLLFPLPVLVVLLFFAPQCSGCPLKTCNFDQIYQLGDSISDTGNLIRENPIGVVTPFARLPYGETFFKNATGRCSNGLLMIDYIAMAAGLPFLNPYKNVDADFKHGVNFAVAGSTALPMETLASKNISSPVTGSSLTVQLDWMSTHFNSICYTEREIGGNDYNYALFQGKSIEEVKNMVPYVVQSIVDAVRKIIHKGAVRMIVPGNFPIGCFPIYLTGFQTNNSAAYDENHCLKNLNNFSMYHNNHLQHSIEELRKEFPNVVIVYGDYYNAFQWLFKNAPFLGFDTTSTQKACCGTGGEYNFSLTKMCGTPEVSVCSYPNQQISWDGVHLTQEAYMIMTRWLLNDIVPQLQCSV